MKNKLQRIAKVVLCCFLLIALSCETDNTFSEQDVKMIEAKTWFDKYQANGINYELFQDLEYKWSEANITKSEDGTETIIVPVIELKEDKEEIWSQKLYLYKLDEGNFKALLFEIYPDKDVLASSQKIDGGDFNGYIATWDLKMGFVRASRFKNNQVVENGIVAVVSIDKKTGKAPAILPCVDDMCQTGPGGLGDAVQLRPVVVKGPSTGTPSSYFGPRTPVTGGTSPGGFTTPGGGGSGGSSTSANANAIEDKIDDSKLDPCAKATLEKLKNLKQNDIASMISKFASNSSIFSLNIQTGKVTKSTNDAETSIISLYNYNITLSTNYINGVMEGEINSPPTTLSLATTLTHEIIHAYLLSVVDEYKTLNSSTICDFPTLYDAYVVQNTPKGGSKAQIDAQHDLIAEKYVNSIASTIQELNTDSPVTSGYPNQVYLDIAWAGLEGTYIFNKNYPNDPNDKNYNDRNRILSRGSIEKYNKPRGNQSPLGKPCK
ncbi:hypothetical protein [Flavobacterium hydatis]|uniref:SprT-like domain-containing protein n=1 Tax=Flavobacterium hydatis TaxID=991 RepID=A0A086A7C3_FLAHY|nr:hypothetical protein [Flavobacterium hydatis]KFF12587.1 hypothetical protein IW20_18550 [Flavobacterium hydatis]OXA92051.1 hypothetical protein B0A62_16795 [Flavobacterium hydatis]